MSKHNKANKDHYVMGGRLSQDDMARARMHQAEVSGRSKAKENVIGKNLDRSGAPAPSRSRSGREE
jgi:hypothetical protein